MFKWLKALGDSELTLPIFFIILLHTPYEISGNYNLYRKAKFDPKSLL